MSDALKWLNASLREGDTVSPACASFDLFENYEDREETT
jgi:UDP-N-acetylmuramoylalanine-D-glutamate ligase